MTKFKFFGKAVKHVLDNTVVGYQSSLDTLVKKAKRHYNGKKRTFDNLKSTACMSRLEWKRENDIASDARTHGDIPGRDMLSTNKMEPSNFNRAIEIAEERGVEFLEEIANLFHHKQQFLQFCDHMHQRAELVVI